MKENFENSFRKLLLHEGTFSNHPEDKGGITMYGVTQRVWEEWVGHPVDEKTMRGLTPETVKPLYKRKYWDKVCGDDLPAGVDYCVFDAAVNSGPGRAIKWLQQALGVTQDGALGPKTLAAAKAADPKLLVHGYNSIRLAFLQELPTWNVFGKGWGRRVAEVKQDASQMTA
jgi:lysozyme family protein